MKVIRVVLILTLFVAPIACTKKRQLKSPCVAAHSSGKNFVPCVRKPVSNVFLA